MGEPAFLTMISLSVIVPVYNEEEMVRFSIGENLKTLQKFNIDYELILVNDGSTDRTGDILREFQSLSRVSLHSNRVNQGFGATVKKGLEYASKEFIIFVPVDSPLSDSVLEIFLKSCQSADILVGYRIAREGYSLPMRVNSIVYHKMISFLFGMCLHDYNWIHLYKREALQRAEIQIESSGVFMLAEVLIKAQRRGLSIQEFPVPHFKRETGIPSAGKFSVMLKTMRELTLFAYHDMRKPT